MANTKNLKRRVDLLFNHEERVNSETTWELLAEFLLPNQFGNFHGNTERGRKNTDRLYDSVAPSAVHDLASTIHSVVTSNAVKWAKFRFKDEVLNNTAEAVDWLEATNNMFHDALNSSNFNTEINKAYKSYVAMGNMSLLMEERKSKIDLQFNGFKFKALHLSQIAWAENEDSSVDVFYRKFKMSARAAVERFGEKCSDKIKQDLENNPEKMHNFIFGVYPNQTDKINYDLITSADSRPFVKCIFEEKGENIVEEGGYYEFPVFCVRWETMPEESYGRGPGHIALPDVRTLNQLKQHQLEALALAVGPPLLTTQRGLLGDVNFKPHGLTVVRNVNDVKPFDMGTRWDVVQFSAADLQEQIRNVFFINKLIFPPRNAQGEMTATEVMERVAQMQKVLGPTMGRLNSELLGPLVQRGFKMMLRGGAFPPIPDVLKDVGASIEIEYVNTLARAQRIEEVQAIQNWANDLAMLAQLGKPEALDNIDADGISALSARIRGVPVSAITNDDVKQALRQQRAEQQQQMQQMDAAMKAADMASKFPKGEGT